jgi:hypothetical protein
MPTGPNGERRPANDVIGAAIKVARVAGDNKRQDNRGDRVRIVRRAVTLRQRFSTGARISATGDSAPRYLRSRCEALLDSIPHNVGRNGGQSGPPPPFSGRTVLRTVSPDNFPCGPVSTGCWPGTSGSARPLVYVRPKRHFEYVTTPVLVLRPPSGSGARGP